MTTQPGTSGTPNDRALKGLIDQTAPSLLELYGVGVHAAATDTSRHTHISLTNHRGPVSPSRTHRDVSSCCHRASLTVGEHRY
jgi:hypothetical protein